MQNLEGKNHFYLSVCLNWSPAEKEQSRIQKDSANNRIQR